MSIYIYNIYLDAYLYIYVSADPLGSSGPVEASCSLLGETRVRETLGPGGPTPRATYPHLPTPTHTYVG